MRLDCISKFDEPKHFRLDVNISDESISILELKVKQIRASYEILKKESQ